MKKDRNTFFQEAQVYNQTGFNPGFNMPNGPITTQSYANQGFYMGPTAGMPLNYNTQNAQNTNTNYSGDYNDYESRLSKLERQINRLEARISKLENGSYYTTEDIETNNNIYMV